MDEKKLDHLNSVVTFDFCTPSCEWMPIQFQEWMRVFKIEDAKFFKTP